jgi:hypothetical protein
MNFVLVGSGWWLWIIRLQKLVQIIDHCLALGWLRRLLTTLSTVFEFQLSFNYVIRLLPLMHNHRFGVLVLLLLLLSQVLRVELDFFWHLLLFIYVETCCHYHWIFV